jgi:hypothetical protein
MIKVEIGFDKVMARNKDKRGEKNLFGHQQQHKSERIKNKRDSESQ